MGYPDHLRHLVYKEISEFNDYDYEEELENQVEYERQKQVDLKRIKSKKNSFKQFKR